MKKFLLLMSVMIVAFQFIGYAQTGFDVLWKIDNWGATHKLSVSALARFSPDGKSIYFVADSSYDKLSRVYQISSETGEAISQSVGTDKIYDFDMSEAGNIYATLYSKSVVGIWDAKTHKLLDSINTDESTSVAIKNIAISPDEKYLIYNYVKQEDNNFRFIISVYDIETKKIIKEIPAFRSTELRYSRDGKTFVAGGVAEIYNQYGNLEKEERLALYDATTWTLKGVLAETGYESGFTNIHYSFDSKYVAATASRLSCINNIETLEKREFTDYPSYSYAIGLTLLKNPNDYIVEYINITTNLSKCVIYNDNKEVNSFNWAYYFLATNNNNDKFKIFACNGPIAVLVPTSTSVKENDETSISVSYSDNVLSVSSTVRVSPTANLIISDVSGKEVYSGAVGLNESGKTPVPLKLENGIYLYRIVLNNQEFTGKFEVVR